MRIFDLNNIAVESEKPWTEFLREPSMSMGVYRLAVGQQDLQQPHSEDEVYVVLSGKALFLVGGQSRPVGPGTVIYIERGIEHRFCDVTEEIRLLVFFAPPEGPLA
jgi:mannose-6-phosphate isomerase-like protein (cupin superfamily)